MSRRKVSLRRACRIAMSAGRGREKRFKLKLQGGFKIGPIADDVINGEHDGPAALDGYRKLIV